MNIIFNNPDNSLYIGTKIKPKIKPISIIQYPYAQFSYIYCVIPEGSPSFIVNEYKRYIPRNIYIPPNIEVTYIHENLFVLYGYTNNHHLHIIDDILFIILFHI